MIFLISIINRRSTQKEDVSLTFFLTSYDRIQTIREKDFGQESKKAEYIELVLQEYQRGLTTDCIAYHGTSLETIIFAINNGFVPGNTNTFDENTNMGDLYCFPLLDANFAFEIQKDTAIYAKINAQILYILSELHLDLNDQELQQAAFDLMNYRIFNPEIYKKSVRTLKINTLKAERIQNEASKRSGVMFGIDGSVIKSFNIITGDPDELDIKIRTKNGLPLKYIRGLKPMGEYEMNYFESLLESRH